MTHDSPLTPHGSAPDFWERTRRAWHLIFYGTLAVMAAVILTQDGLSERDRVVALGALGILALAYAVAGRHALGSDRTSMALLYLVPAWAALLVVISVDPAGYLLLFILFPQTWAMLRRTWQAVVWTLVAAAVLALMQLGRSDVTGSSASDALLTFVFNAGLSLLLGLWITGIVRESNRRAALIAELQRTRADLAEAERDSGALAERERLAHEIHDTLAQGFTSILALSQAIEAGWEHDPDAARDRLSLLQRTARENLAEARSLVAALGPVDLRESDLAGALARVVERFSRESGVPAELTVSGDARPLSPSTDVVLVRTTQEALANVRKHAGAGHVVVQLTYAPDGHGGASLDVVDDGSGVSAEAAEGFGLRGMRERATQVGGTVLVDEPDDGGTRVHVEVR